jgi:hypothetical protein
VSAKKEARDTPAALVSNELQITITQPTKSWQDDKLKTAVAMLDKASQTNNQSKAPNMSTAENDTAVKTLRYLGTSDSIKVMAGRLTADDSPATSQFFLGLVSAYDPKEAAAELQRLVSDPDYPITQNFLFAVKALQRSPDQSPDAGDREDERNWEAITETVQQSVSRKRGKALAITLTTILSTLNSSLGKSQHVSDAMVAQIVSVFDQLPIEKQTEVLNSRWTLVEGPAFLPILRKYAQQYKDFPVRNESNASNSLQLSSRALLRWYELEPDEARKVIIQEIVRPKPRYGARVLGVLPDETLPEVDHVLAEHFATDDDSDEASLINRYATDSILPQVLAVADKHIGKWACANQEPILAYLLRIDPEAARPRLEAAIAARGNEYTACNHALFVQVGDLYQSPVLEELAIKALNDSDPQVAANAAAYLGKYGSIAAEEKLWERLSSWNETWKGRDQELYTTATEVNPNQWDRSLGDNLIRALTNAKSWTLDESKLRKLRQLVSLSDFQKDVDSQIDVWLKKPWIISFEHAFEVQRFQVLKYETDSIKAVEEKLAHFPAGSSFEWRPVGGFTSREESDRIAKELSEFLSSHGMKLTIPPG